jgi:hypothetical protein
MRGRQRKRRYDLKLALQPNFLRDPHRAVHRAQYWLLDQLVVEHNKPTIALFEGCNHAARMSDGVFRGAEDLI